MAYIDLEQFISLDVFDSLQDEIHTAFVEGKKYAISGTYQRQLTDDKITSKPKGVKLLQEAVEEFLALSDDDPIKDTGLKLYRENKSFFTTYIKLMMQAYDPFHYYTLIGRVREQDQPLVELMPGLCNWLKYDLKVKNRVFEHIEKITFIVCDANGITWDHKDLDCMEDFIYIRPNLEKPCYIWDPKTKTKTYINSRAATWNVNSWTGAEQINYQTYALRLEGIYTEEFRQKIKNV